MPDPSSRRPEPTDPRGLLPDRYAGLPLRRLGAGWDNVGYALGDDLLMRVSLLVTPSARAAAVTRDRLLLNAIPSYAGVTIPSVTWADPPAGVTIGPLVTGAVAATVPTLDPEVFGASVGRFLRHLHDVPVTAIPVDLSTWSARVGHARAAASVADLPLAPADRALIDSVLARPLPAPVPPVLVHNDLGEDHLFVGESGELSGVIDWSDAAADDPARDFALVLFDFGERAFQAALSAYGGDLALADRARWFAARAGVEGVGHRIRHGEGGVRETLDRIAACYPG
ncbi:phosphotransferase [Calidifontibacter sp. DB0510]|uniref:Phosphotransferase n=1 Tax=Metallococcus carri TaxID=1656884 RepID=A0A967AXX7_9MICO|nr:phosphotransferase [Metallococcus carri]NHN55041.1 phosphotransferase [Metallococcus carri]NOP37387.1 phosphotransferase [Calidifontibacter sp. DB2511S]